MKTDYADMTPIEIRVAIIRASTTQAEIARSAAKKGGTCSRVTVCRVIDGKIVSDRVRREIAEAIRIPVENIWRSYYLSQKETSDGRVSKGNHSMSAAL
mgnify:CR=1 FL=1